MDYEFNKMENEVVYKDYDSEDIIQNEKADKLCRISLSCVFVPIFIVFGAVASKFILWLLVFAFVSEVASKFLVIGSALVIILSCLSILIGIALDIYVRVKYPRNTFGKGLMWIYLILVVLIVIGVIMYNKYMY